jgi:hypothetical protein
MEQVRELDRVTTTFATTMRERTLQIQGTISSFGAAIEASVARLGAATGAGATLAAGSAAPVAGIQLVKVVNDRGAPLPVTVITDLAAPLPVVLFTPPKPEAEGTWGKIKEFISTFGSTISGFVGGFVGEIASGIAKPVTAVAAGIEMLLILPQVAGLVREIGSVLDQLIKGIQDAIDKLFDRLESAGVFPVEKLRDTLLGFVESGMALVIAQITPLMAWVEGLLAGVADWLGATTVALAGYLNLYLNQVAAFLTRYKQFLLDATGQWLRATLVDAVAGVLGTILGGLDALGNVLIAAFKFGAALIGHAFELATRGFAILFNLYAALKGIPLQVPVPEVGPAPKAPDFGAVASAAMKEGKWAGREIATMLLGEPGAVPKAPKLGPPPVLVQPLLQLPARPGPEGAEATLEPRAAVLPAAPSTATRAGTAAAGPEGRRGGLTVTGGVTVNVRAETLDLANADEAARRLAATLLDELDRLVARHAFRRGLPTGAVP